MASDRVRLYLDNEGKWRWRRWRGSDIIADSAQGYVTKRDCLMGIAAISRSTYQLTYESRRNDTGRAYQQGRLVAQGQPDIPVEVTPWTLDHRASTH